MVARLLLPIERGWPFISLSLVVIACSLGLVALTSSLVGPVTLALITCVLVVGLYVLVGNSGVLSFGQIGFMGIGAYATAILTIPAESKPLVLPSLPGFLAEAQLAPLTAILVSAAIVGVLAYLLAIPLMRLTGLTAGIATFALLLIVNNVLNSSVSITGGSGALSGIPYETTVSVALVWAIIAIAVAFAFQSSRYGLALRASREDEYAAQAIGIRVHRLRRMAFTVSAVLSAVGGGLFAMYVGSISPASFYVDLTFATVAMLVIGGRHSLAGAVVGTLALSAISELVRRGENGVSLGFTELYLPQGTNQVAFALLLLLILWARPMGLTRGRELNWPRRWTSMSANRGQVDRQPLKRKDGVEC